MQMALVGICLALGSGVGLGLDIAEGPEAEASVPVSGPTADVSAAALAEDPAPTEVAGPSEPMPAAASTSAPPEPISGPQLQVADVSSEPSVTIPSGPPFYSESDLATLRGRYGLDPAVASERKARWRCLVADPTCSFNVEINATSAYAYRFHQGNPVSQELYRWSSGRSQFDLWLNLPGVIESHGLRRFTRLSLGPKGGVIVSDSKNIWGNAGLAMRYWFGRGRFSPTIELSSALTYRLATADPTPDSATAGQLVSQRSPLGVTADVGFGLGGFGALIIGGQFDSPLAREDVSEAARIYPSGMVFIGFRGNIIWGAPAAAAIGTTALTQQAKAPLQQ